MSPDRLPDPTDRTTRLDRRRFIAAGAGLGATLLAGCSASGPVADTDGGGDATDGSDATGTSVGTFRLLISDQPVAIDEFDSLEVSFDRARVFKAGAEDATATLTASPSPTATGNESTTESPTATATATGTATETEEPDEEPDEEEADEDDEDGEEGFTVLDLGGATVDLTQVVGDKAMGVFEGELEAGRYTKIELYAAEVGGVVDGESVEVTIPPGKLMIVKPFEVVPGETLSFVFDINVVRKGGTGEYNLLPVISESGVAGKDVDVEEVRGGGPDGDDEAEETEATEATEADDGGGDGGPPSEAGNASGNA